MNFSIRPARSATIKLCSAVGGSVCPICLEKIDELERGVQIPCGHAMHFACQQRLVRSSRSFTVNSWGVKAVLFSCPECRAEFGMSADGCTCTANTALHWLHCTEVTPSLPSSAPAPRLPSPSESLLTLDSQ